MYEACCKRKDLQNSSPDHDDVFAWCNNRAEDKDGQSMHRVMVRFHCLDGLGSTIV